MVIIGPKPVQDRAVGPWMCTAVVSPIKLAKTMLIFIVFDDVSIISCAVPFPMEGLGVELTGGSRRAL